MFKAWTGVVDITRLDPALEYVYKEGVPISEQKSPDPNLLVAREVQEFPQENSMTPNFGFVNTLYVYPEFVS